MVRGLTPVGERRRTPRVCPSRTEWQETALLRPGQDVVILNLSRGGALLESKSRMAPGGRAELHLFGDRRRVVRGRIERCHIVRLEPLRYTGAMVFDGPLDLGHGVHTR